MRLYVSRPWTDHEIATFVNVGADNNCPFCLARHRRKFSPGTKLVLLCGPRAGMRATVVECGDSSTGRDQICIRGEGQSRPGMRVFSPNDFLAAAEPLPPPPSWLPPLSCHDLFCIDEAVLYALSGCFRNGKVPTWISIFRAIHAIWSLRLPVRAREVFPVFRAHGLAGRYEKKFNELFDFGLDLLIDAQGRAPVQRRRMPAMSRGQYEPAHRNPMLRELRAKLRSW